MMTPDGKSCRGVMSRLMFPYTSQEIELPAEGRRGGSLVPAELAASRWSRRKADRKENSFAQVFAHWGGGSARVDGALLGRIHDRRPHGNSIPVWHAGGEPD